MGECGGGEIAGKREEGLSESVRRGSKKERGETARKSAERWLEDGA